MILSERERTTEKREKGIASIKLACKAELEPISHRKP